MRVAYVCADAGVPVFGTKGCSVHVQEIISQFVKLDCTLTLFAVRAGGQNYFANESVRFREFSLCGHSDVRSRELLQVAAAEKIASHLEASEFDLVYERYSLWSSATLTRAAQLGLPTVLEVNAPLIEEQAVHRTLVDRERAVAIRDEAFEAATSIIAVSDKVADYVRDCLPATQHRKVHVVTNGVDTDRFRPDVPPITKSEQFTVGFLGTLKPWHGLESLLAAFHMLHSKNPNVRLRIIGDGPMRETLQCLVASEYVSIKSSIDWVGAVAPRDVPRYLTSLDVAVAPYPESTNFYFSPLKVFEYMAAGCAVVASSIGQLKAVVQHGCTGWLYPPGDTASLAQALSGLADSPEVRAQLGQAARKFVLRHHSWQQTLQTILRHVHIDHDIRRSADSSTMESTTSVGQ